MRQTDILIAGGGIAGLSLALLLDHAGLRADMIEPFPPAPVSEVKPSGRTVALLESSLNILRPTGVVERITDFANPLSVMRILDENAGSRVDVSFEAGDLGQERYGLNIPNAYLRAALYEIAVERGIVIHNTKLVGYEVLSSGITGALDDGTPIKAQLLVGVDGRNSKVRELAGVECWSASYDQAAITFVINHSNAHQDTATEFHRPAGPLALVPLPGNQSSVVWVESKARAAELMDIDTGAMLEIFKDAIGDTLGGVTLETKPESWPLSSLRAKEMIAPRVALAAEAAHVMSPITAQGLNLSLRDVAALAEEIVDAARLGLDPGSAAVLERYAKRRRLDVRSRVFGVDRVNKIVSSDVLPLHKLRRAGLTAMDKIPPLKTAVTHLGLAPRIDQGRLAKGKSL